MFVFGGLVEEIGAVREMWKYSIDTNIWRQLTVSGTFCIMTAIVSLPFVWLV